MFLVPWVPETFHARFLVSVNRSSAEDPVYRPKGDTEASRRPREKILRFSGYLSCALKVESSASWAATIFVTNVVTLTISFFSLSSRISLPDLPQSFSMFQNNTWCVCLCRWGRGQFRYSSGEGVNSCTFVSLVHVSRKGRHATLLPTNLIGRHIVWRP